jgi:hypothetical protein
MRRMSLGRFSRWSHHNARLELRRRQLSEMGADWHHFAIVMFSVFLVLDQATVLLGSAASTIVVYCGLPTSSAIR